MLQKGLFLVFSLIVLPIVSYLFITLFFDWYSPHDNSVFILLTMIVTVVYHFVSTLLSLMIYYVIRERLTNKKSEIFLFGLLYSSILLLSCGFTFLEFHLTTVMLGIQVLFLFTIYHLKFFWRKEITL